MASWSARFELCRGAEQSETGIVDHVGRLEPALAEGFGQPLGPRASGQIGGDRLRTLVAGGGDLIGERIEFGLTPRGEHERVAVAREFARERSTNAGGGAGDQADWLDR